MNNLLQILLGLVIAAFVTLLAAPYFIDWNQYKSEIEAQASKLIGRQLTVAGDVNLRLLPAPYLQLEDITVNNLEPSAIQNSRAPSLLTAKSFRLWLSAPPLLRGVIEVQEIEVAKPHLRFAIDENGQSNWSNDLSASASLPFTPTAISLQSMTIEDGRLEISVKAPGNEGSATKNRTVNIHALNGDFSAGSLKGPYKFEGTIGEGDKKQILRLSTGSIDEKNEMRVKSILRSPKDGHRFSFDGALIDLKNQPTMNGVLSASFPFFDASKNSTGKIDQASGSINRTKPLEVKTSISANSNGALFDKILVTIVHKNRPQALTGKGRLSWEDGQIDLDGNLNARLIDIDHLKDGMKVGNSVGENVSNLFANLRTQAAKVDRGRFHININQIKLNGDLVQDLKINLEQSGSGLIVKKMGANLPGDNMIDIQGGFAGSSKASPFKGRGVVRGQSLGHLVTWGAGTKIDGGVSAIRSHPFTLRGDLLFGGGRYALNNVNGDIAGTSFTGQIRHRNGTSLAQTKSGQPERGIIDIKLTTSEINSTALVGRPVAMKEILQSLLNSENPKKPTSPAGPARQNDVSSFSALVQNNALNLQLRAGRLRLEDFDGRDLVADIFYGQSRLQINQLSLRSKNGLRLQADGTIINLEKTPSGTLTATVNIEDPSELQHILAGFESSTNSVFSEKQTAALTPLRLAIMLQTDSKSGAEANVRINGIAGSSHIAINNRIIGEHLFSRDEQRAIKQVELSGTIANKDGRLILTQLVPYLPIDPSQLQEIGSGKVWFSAAGLPEIGLKSRIEFNSQRVTAGLNGLLGWQNGIGSFNGETHLKAKDIASGLALIGIDIRGTKTTGSLDLAATLDKKAGKYDFTRLAGSIASSDVEGRATLDIDTGGNKLDLVLLTSTLHVPSLFSPLLEKPLKIQNAGDQSDRQTDPVKNALQLANIVQGEVGTSEPSQTALMTSRRFSSELLKNISAQILVTADELYLTDTIKLQNADLSAEIDKRKITINNLGGQIWNGSMHSTGVLDLSSTLAQVNGDLSITNVSIEKGPFLVEKSPVLTGKTSLDLKFSGRGIGPAGLFSLMNGTGKLQLENAKINHYSSSVLTDIVDDQLSVWKQSEDQTPFKERFKRHLVHADFDLPAVSEEFTIKDGTLELKTTQLSQNNSKVELDASLTLASMTTHSRLTIAPLKEAKYANIPSASVLYEGSLTKLDKIIPKIDTASLEQYLTVMKMEHDVNLLEKLHKRDEEFAVRASERRAQINREREEREAQEALEAEKDQLENPAPNANPLQIILQPDVKGPGTGYRLASLRQDKTRKSPTGRA